MKHNKITEKIVGAEVLEQARQIYRKNSEQLERYIDLLLEWNEKINLVSRTVSRETVREHVVHSLLPIPLGLLNSHKIWIDSGTGGGLPGLPLAVCIPDSEWILNDNIRKKMKAVHDIIQQMPLPNAGVTAKSISLVQVKEGMGIVTKHAFKLDNLLQHLNKKPWQTILMWKGIDDAMIEFDRANKKIKGTFYRFDFGENEFFYEGKGLVLIEKQKDSQRPIKYRSKQ